MATMAVMGSEAVTKMVREARERLTEAERALKAVEDQIVEESDKLAATQVARVDECKLLALGKKGDPGKFDEAIRLANDRIIGLTASKRTRERVVAELRADFYNATAEQTRIENEKADREEFVATRGLIEQTNQAVDARDAAERQLLNGLTQLRGRKYRCESNRQLAMNAAQSAQRRWNGMRP